MKSFSKDYLRQIEILAQCLNGSIYSKADYSSLYDVSEITINRDLEALRKFGIQIFSRKGRVVVESLPPKQLLQYLVADYLPVKLNSDVFIKPIRLLSQKSNNTFFQLLTLLAKSVNESLIINIEYCRLYDNKILNYKLKPIRLSAVGLN